MNNGLLSGSGRRSASRPVKVWDGSQYRYVRNHALFVDPTGGNNPATVAGGRSKTGDLWLKPPPRELAYADQSAAVTGIAGSETDITGLSITFTITAAMLADYPVVEVVADLPYVFSATAAVNGSMNMTDGSNVQKKAGLLSMYASGAFSSPGHLVERISAAGTYTRKIRVVRASGTGTMSVGLAATPTTFGSIVARQVAQ